MRTAAAMTSFLLTRKIQNNKVRDGHFQPSERVARGGYRGKSTVRMKISYFRL